MYPGADGIPSAAADATAGRASDYLSHEAGATAETAFRRAEKRYQLHYEQKFRKRNGRLKGGKLIEMPTDLSGVADVRSDSVPDATMVTVQQPQPIDPTSCSHTALVFQRHPGLVVFPAAVSADLQLQLIRAALEEWPEPPARTNHTKAYGMALCQLFQAAQQGMCLSQAPHQHTDQLPSTEQQDHHKQQQQQPYTDQGQQQAEQQQQTRQGTHSQQQDVHLHQHDSQPQPQQDCGDLSSRPDSSSSSSSNTGSPWGLQDTGPKAAMLLRKLRWVCLGPPYNWTDRVYEPHLPHRALPPALVQLGCRFAALAVQAAQQAACCSSSVPALRLQHTAIEHSANAAGGSSTADGGAAAAAAAAGAGGGSHAGYRQQKEPGYVPNAALVNYYHAGDTLNGHKDDVESDLTQPIVTLSLGCDAVFLVGGQTKDVEPTALLLRSGDVVVMGQEARACYHGVPRVLPDRPLPQDLQQASEQASELYRPHLLHMKGSRINISIRAT